MSAWGKSKTVSAAVADAEFPGLTGASKGRALGSGNAAACNATSLQMDKLSIAPSASGNAWQRDSNLKSTTDASGSRGAPPRPKMADLTPAGDVPHAPSVPHNHCEPDGSEEGPAVDDPSVRDPSMAMMKIKNREWNEDKLRYACQLVDSGKGYSIAAREAGCIIGDLKQYYEHDWRHSDDDDDDDCSGSDDF